MIYGKEYKPYPKTKGVFYHHLSKIRNFVLFESSSNSSSSHGEYNITTNNDRFWQSETKKGSNFTITFYNKLFKLSSFSMKSCDSYQCVNTFNVYGSNIGESWDQICFVNEAKGYFKAQISNSICKSNFPYKKIMFVLNDLNENNQYAFSIHYLELFGTMINQEMRMISCGFRSRNNHFMIFLISSICS